MAAASYDGVEEETLAERLGVPRVRSFAVVESTQDEAHRLAGEGAPSGTVVIADAQRSGRGRGGRRWASASGAGIWFSFIERPEDARALDVLSLRLGLAAASALEPFATGAVRLKWPNDLVVDAEKLAGVLVEARWRDGAPEWVTIGIGVNTARPDGDLRAAALRPGVGRVTVLATLIPALRGAAARTGWLSDDELRAFAERDLARGRWCSAPAAGQVVGIDADGSLVVRTAEGITRCRGGSLILDEADA